MARSAILTALCAHTKVLNTLGLVEVPYGYNKEFGVARLDSSCSELRRHQGTVSTHGMTPELGNPLSRRPALCRPRLVQACLWKCMWALF